MNTINLRFLNVNNEHYPIWHPYAHIKKGYDLINIAEGEDCYLYDINGKEYMDASSGLWNVSLGYSNAKIKNNIIEQMNKLPFCSLFDYTNQTAVLAARKILSLMEPFYRKVFFTCSGSESIELSVKLMRKYWQSQMRKHKSMVLTFKNSYHGTYYASLSASHLEEAFLEPYKPMVPNFFSLTSGVCTDCEAECCDMRCMDYIETYIRENYQSIAGIIIEPILASSGVKIVGKPFLESLCKLCSLYEILVTIDEIATGFFRTGEAFYYQELQIFPDIVCIGKGINSGYLPLGAVIIKEDMVTFFSDANDVLVHGSTQNGNLLACSAVIAAIDQYIDLDIRSNVSRMGRYIKEQLAIKLSKHENVKEVRGKGLLLEIELNVSAYFIVEIQAILLQKALIVYRSHIGLTILPMLIINKEQADFIIGTISEVFLNILI